MLFENYLTKDIIENYKRAIANNESYDSWGDVMYGDDNRAVDYNMYIDGTTDELIICSAFYRLIKGSDGLWCHDDCSNYYSYNIDFSDHDWEIKLKEACKIAFNELYNII